MLNRTQDTKKSSNDFAILVSFKICRTLTKTESTESLGTPNVNMTVKVNIVISYLKK